MTAETLANDNLSTPANDDMHQLHTVNNSGNSVTLRDSVEVALKNYFEQLDGAPVSKCTSWYCRKWKRRCSNR